MRPKTSTGKEFTRYAVGIIEDFVVASTPNGPGRWLLVVCKGQERPLAIDNWKAQFNVEELKAKYVGWRLNAPMSSAGSKWDWAAYASSWKRRFPADLPGAPDIPEIDDEELRLTLKNMVLEAYAVAAHWNEAEVFGTILKGDEKSDEMGALLDSYGRSRNLIGATWSGMVNEGLIDDRGDAISDRTPRNNGRCRTHLLTDAGVQAVIDYIRLAKPVKPLAPSPENVA